MPKQAIYTLASRFGNEDKKKEIIKNYSGQPKNELLSIIRKLFPLDKNDKRAPNIANNLISLLIKANELIEEPLFNPKQKQKKQISNLLSEIKSKLK